MTKLLMPQPNIKLYLALSAALIVLFLSVLLIPFGKKNQPQEIIKNEPTPTSIQTRDGFESQNPITDMPENGFTGVKETTLPPEEAEFAKQHIELSNKTPLKLPSSTIDFDYKLYKFTVTLNEPKDQAKKEFQEWLKANYPSLGEDQFIIK